MKDSTLYKGCNYSKKNVSDLDPAASEASRCLFHAAPLLQISVQECLTFKASRQLKMSHFFQRGWGVLLLPRITMVSFTCRFIRLIWGLDCHVDILQNPLAGNSIYCAFLDKSTWYSCGPLLDGVYGVSMILDLPCWYWIWVVRDISAKYATHSKHWMWCHLHAWYDWNVLFILHLYAACESLPKTWQVWQIMPTISVMFVFNLRYPNTPVSISNEHWSYSGWVDAIKPLTAYNKEDTYCPDWYNNSGPNASSTMIIIQFLMTASTTKLDIFGSSGYTLVTPQNPSKGSS